MYHIRSMAAISSILPLLSTGTTSSSAADSALSSQQERVNGLVSAIQSPERSLPSNDIKAVTDGLVSAIKNKQIIQFNTLLAKKPALNWKSRETGYTLLHLAAGKDFPEAIAPLLASGLKIDALNDNGFSPLAVAVNFKNLGATLALLAKKSDPNWKYRNNDNTLLHLAAEVDFPEAIAPLLASGLKIDALNDDRLSPLAVAIYYKNLGATLALLAKKSDPNWKYRNNDNTLLHLAAGKDFPEAIAPLLASGLKIDALNDDGFSPLALAIYFKKSGATLALLAQGADRNWKCKKTGYTLLHLVAQVDFPEAIAPLLAKGLYIDALDYYGFSPLAGAVYFNNLTAADALLAQGADRNWEHIRNKETLLHIAAQQDPLGSLRSPGAMVALLLLEPESETE